MLVKQHPVPVHALTAGSHHFFGYYDKTPWDATGRYVLALSVDFMGRQPTQADAAVVGMIDTHDDNHWIALGKTTAWNWQQGTMLQWLPGEPERKIIFNQRDAGRYVSIICDIHTRETRQLPLPVYAVNGTNALSLNFSRLHRLRPGYGYVGIPDPYVDNPHPAEDGIYWMSLETDEYRLLISYDDMRCLQPVDSMANSHHRFNHIHIAPDGSNFVWLHRWHDAQQRRIDRLLTANMDGSDIAIVADDGYVSHIDYYTTQQVVAWARHPATGKRYLRYMRHSDACEVIGAEVFSSDGHCSFSPDRQWMLTDTYPDAENMRTLMLYHMETNTRYDIGRFYAPPELAGPVRCDLHPRWSRDGRQVCIDSAHTGERQVYVLDVAPILETVL